MAVDYQSPIFNLNLKTLNDSLPDSGGKKKQIIGRVQNKSVPRERIARIMENKRNSSVINNSKGKPYEDEIELKNKIYKSNSKGGFKRSI